MTNPISNDMSITWVPTPVRNTSTEGNGLASADGIPLPVAPPAQGLSPGGAGTAPDDKALQAAIDQIAGALKGRANSLSFAIDHATGSTVVKVLDGQTGKVIRQIPSEETLEIAQSIDKTLSLMKPQQA